jgi:hypothetical protein
MLWEISLEEEERRNLEMQYCVAQSDGSISWNCYKYKVGMVWYESASENGDFIGEGS